MLLFVWLVFSRLFCSPWLAGLHGWLAWWRFWKRVSGSRTKEWQYQVAFCSRANQSHLVAAAVGVAAVVLLVLVVLVVLLLVVGGVAAAAAVAVLLLLLRVECC